MENCKYPYLAKVMKYSNCWECIFNCLQDNKKEMETKEYEHSDKRICKYWLQIESCRQCLFDALCQYEARKWEATHDVEATS